MILRKDGGSSLLLILTKVFKTDKVQKWHPPFPISVFVHNEGFNYINLWSILDIDNIKNLFPNKLKIGEPPSVVYSPFKEMRNKILNYKEIVSSVDTSDDKIYGTSIKCDWKTWRFWGWKSWPCFNRWPSHILNWEMWRSNK